MSESPHPGTGPLWQRQVRMHHAGLPVAVGTGTVLALMLLVVLWGSAERTSLLAWYGAMLVAGSVNLQVWRRHRAAGHADAGPADTADPRWLPRYRACLALRGVAWGLCSLLLWPAVETGLQTLLVTALMIVCAMTLAATPMDRLGAALFVGPALLPLLARLLASGHTQALVLALMLLVLLVGVALTVQNARRQLMRSDARRTADAMQTKAVLRSEQQLREAEHLAALGSFDWQIDLGQLHWSDQHFRLWGLEPGTVVPTYAVYRAGLHADDRSAVEALLERALTGPTRYDCTHRVVGPDGSERRIHARGEVFFDAAGRAQRMIGTVQDITERVRAEASLRMFEFVVNAIADPVSVVDERQAYRIVNDAWCRNNGLPREAAVGRTVEEVFPVVTSQRRRQAIVDCIAQGTEQVVRGPSPSLHTRDRFLETRYFPFIDPAVDWRGVVMISRDITDAEASRAALASSVEHLRLTLNTTGDAIFATDARSPHEPVLFANEKLLQLWDIPASEGSRVTPAMIIAHARSHFVDPDREVARIAEVISSGLPQEDRLTLRDGRVLVRRCIPTLELGRQVRVWGFRDVTAESQALQALREAEARQRTLLDAFPGYITALDEQLRYRYVNARVAELLGVDPQQVVGKHLTDLHPPEHAEHLARGLRRAFAGESVIEDRHYSAVPGRPSRDHLITLAVGHQPDGTALCYAFGTDITTLKATEAALVAARDEAERANRAKSQFLASMSHELRTPLNAVLGFGQLLERNAGGRLTDKQLHQVREIQRGGQHLLALINDLLDLARIEAGRMDVSIEPVALPSLVDDCVQLMQPVAARHGMRLEMPSVEDCSVVVLADRMRLKQVLLNLLSNAIKYNRPGGRVRLACRAVDGQARLEVHDEGPGLDEAAQSRLFLAFERLGAEKSGTEGTGIGLALSHQLVRLMHGEIGIDSVPGQGSCFWVRLRQADAWSAQPGRRDAEAEAPTAGGAPKLVGKVLCIDDNPVNLALMEGLLDEHTGLRVWTTEHPAEGIELARRERPDLVLVDLQMPGIDGQGVLRRLRADALTAAIPVIAISANAMPETIEACLREGFADYITKPVDGPRLLRAMRATLGGRG
ncbi:PAS domain-containing protein [Ideonella sp. A 288]|uniref:PAS domain-containing protein n=1 Tax=Ideonella sp. A 288 TaxID=1962181 RepID=UPI001184A04F|nr:PAS domain-containing protein [Ideonella sp. A 288]